MAFMAPRDIIRQLPILPGDFTLDIGCGAGAFTLEIAKLFPSNRIMAIDINELTLDLLAHNAVIMKHNGIQTMCFDIRNRWPLMDLVADSALLVNVLHAIDRDHISNVFTELYRVMKPHAYVIVADWSSVGAFGPKHNVVDALAMRNIIENNKFKIIKNIPAGTHHYGYMIEKL